MKKLLVLLLGISFVSLAQAETFEVDITNFAFTPQVIDITQGDTVRWTNQDSAPHLVQGEFATGPNMASGQTYEFTFNQAGTFDYICQYHPSMTGTIRVALGGNLPVSAPEESLLDDESEFEQLFGGTQEPSEVGEDLFTQTEPIAEIPQTAPPLVNTNPAPTMNHGAHNMAEVNHSAAAGQTSLPTSGGTTKWLYIITACVVFLALISGFRRS